MSKIKERESERLSPSYFIQGETKNRDIMSTSVLKSLMGWYETLIDFLENIRELMIC